MNTVYLNGQYLPQDEACVPVMDRGFLLGDGVYEVIPVFGGRLFRAAGHLKRLQHSLDGVRISNPHTDAQWRSILHTLIEKQAGVDQSVYLQVTRGVADKRDHAFPVGITPTVFAMSNPIHALPEEYLQQGISAITLDDIRWQLCDIKAITLLPNAMMRQQAVEASAQEAILIKDGLAIEGAASNLFIVRDNALITPPKSHALLPGITRDLMLDLASEIATNSNLQIEERDIAEAELSDADEIWMTSSVREVLPVTTLNGKPVGKGQPGAIWQQMIASYRDYKQRFRAGETD